MMSLGDFGLPEATGCYLAPRRARQDASSLQAGPIPSGWAPKGVLSVSSTEHSTHLRLRIRRSARRCSAISLARSRALLASAGSFIGVFSKLLSLLSKALPPAPQSPDHRQCTRTRYHTGPRD